MALLETVIEDDPCFLLIIIRVRMIMKTQNIFIIMSFVVSCIALYFSYLSYSSPYINAEGRLRTDELYAFHSVGLSLENCNKSYVSCKESSEDASKALEAFQRNVESERSSLSSELYEQLQLKIIIMKNTIKSKLLISELSKPSN